MELTKTQIQKLIDVEYDKCPNQKRLTYIAYLEHQLTLIK